MGLGKIITIEGTDCSGKGTQTGILLDRLKEDGCPIATMDFPRYSTPTGRIVGECYLGKPEMGESYFENAVNLDPKIASLYYAADRRAALPEIHKILNSGTNLILDRYVGSNMAHQGGKIRNEVEREVFYRELESLEYGILELPKPDLTLFLHMPSEVGIKLRESREAGADVHEADPEHLRNAEEAFIQLARIGDWKTISCSRFGQPRSRHEIHTEVYNNVGSTLSID